MHTSKSPQVRRNSPALPARWCYDLFRALPGDRALLPRSSCGSSRKPWRQRRGVRTTRLRRPPQAPLVLRRQSVHRIPPHVRDDRERPLRSGTRKFVEMICPTGQAEYFCAKGWTGFRMRPLICPSGKSKRCIQGLARPWNQTLSGARSSRPYCSSCSLDSFSDYCARGQPLVL